MIKTARGAKIYEGKPCPQGHVVRYAANGNCVACAIENVRKSEWHATHHPEINRKSRLRHKARRNEYNRQYHAANRARICERKRQRRLQLQSVQQGQS